VTRYRLPDEPRPGALRQAVVKPLWPLFAIMTGGPLLSWVWFVVNGWALGSPTRVRETLVALGGFAGTVVLVGIMLALAASDTLNDRGVAYAMVFVSVWKLGVSYLLHRLQSQGFEIYAWYGGVVRNGIFLALFGGLFLRRLLDDAPPLLRLVIQ
jgi:hypothetical protein